MTTIAEVRLWGRTIGAVSLEEGADTANFQYDPDFAHSGIQVSPLAMPLAETVYRFPELPRTTFHGLPGLLSDSLPDRFGNALIDTWLATQGRSPDSFNAVERLCYIGERGMGALEFRPASGPKTTPARQIEIEKLVELASRVLSSRGGFHTSFSETSTEHALGDILRVGTSAGGARAKAVIAWNPQTREVRSGQVRTDEGFEYWLLKFDGVSGNRDKEREDPKGYGEIEYAYHLMALDAGIDMMPCQLLEENGRKHFMTRRFDRDEDGEKIHMQSLCALAHYDFNQAGAYSYEQALWVIRKLALPMETMEQQFRRMAFNILARNQDDHVKNIAFLMDPNGNWSLAPAFDLTFSFNPKGLWTSRHQMTMNGKRDNFTLEDFANCAKTVSMRRGRAKTLVREIEEIVSRWQEYAEKAGIEAERIQQIQNNLRRILS